MVYNGWENAERKVIYAARQRSSSGYAQLNRGFNLNSEERSSFGGDIDRNEDAALDAAAVRAGDDGDDDVGVLVPNDESSLGYGRGKSTNS